MGATLPQPCDECRCDSRDPGVAARERAFLGIPPRGQCCAWSKAELEKQPLTDAQRMLQMMRGAGG